MGNRKIVIGVMGGSSVSKDVLSIAQDLGRQIAESGYVLLTGGRPAGVMEAASHGAKKAGGLVVGILPGPNLNDCSRFVDIAIATNAGDARNVFNILSSDVVVACPGGMGTLSEIALAIKNNRPVILLGFDKDEVPKQLHTEQLTVSVKTPLEAMEKVKTVLQQGVF